MSQTFIFIKPDAIERRLSGNILKMIEDENFKMVRKTEVTITKELILTHYLEVIERLNSRAFVEMVENEFVGKTVGCFIFEHENNAVEIMRTLVGATNPAIASIHSIRGKYAKDSYLEAKTEHRIIRNLIHTSKSKEKVKEEIDLWFERQGILTHFDFDLLDE